MGKISLCEGCHHWDQRFPENKQLGVCLRMGVVQFNTHVAITTATAGRHATSDFEAVRTRKDFGCIFHSDNIEMTFAGE